MLQLTEIVTGKWNSNKYTVLSKLGEGGIGAVYKVKDIRGNIRALKISEDINSITREFNMLTKLKQLKNIPNAYEIDDYKKNKNTYYFFIMDYIEGYNIKEIIKHGKIKVKDIIGIGIILLNILEKIYKMGYVYADMKPDNIMIDKRLKKVNFIDFGGVIEVGQGVKEFTPTYSTFFWGADRNYDYVTNLNFSVAMIITSMLLKREFNPLVHNLEQVISNIKLLAIDNRLKKCLIKALKGEINHIKAFREELKKLFKDCNSSLMVMGKLNSKTKANRKMGIIDAFFIFSIGFFLIVMIIGVNTYLFSG
ncbi:AarF/UbiB family protein [Proteiniborus sp. MB09-C3]|uniref:protein kinase domain-containing protein n=1 Tax=Proteiniborus sp. MB09-C3 TaxID=3050072 RepID=UPI00255460DD|nr:AarF/UbiB family protein [Proteiniborus sp. MB09-C3]WIV13053.1 AarF/UbiB family protein [Proteiniborus sp. MB09-C3]